MFKFFSKPASTTAPENVGSQPKQGVEVLSDDPLAPAEDRPVTATVTPEEIDRINKLGVLLVNMNVASEEKVFGSANSATMKAFRAQKSPDLIIVNRPEDDLPAHQTRWYKPWTWFGGGRRLSPARWADVARSAGVTGLHLDELPVKASEDSPVDAERKAAIESAVDDRMREKKEETDAQKQSRRRRKRAGLPPVVLESLSDKQVQDDLTPIVRADREKLLESERTIHELLQGIEDTRFRYLVPSMEIKCEKPVLRVIQCYDKHNRLADDRLRRESKARQAHNDLLPPALRASAEDEELAVKRAVNYEVLACGDAVHELRRCADDMVIAYSKGAGMKP